MSIRLIFLSVVALIITLSGPVAAQGKAKAPPPCRADAHFRDFDFWLGKWKVYNRVGKKQFAGDNHISAIEGGCAILEQWKGKGGGTGKSVNYYNPINKKWRQIWLSAGNYMIDIEGGMVDGSMNLAGKIYYYTSGVAADFRGIWTPNEDGSVRQHFQQMNPKTGKWAEWFDGRYVKSE